MAERAVVGFQRGILYKGGLAIVTILEEYTARKILRDTFPSFPNYKADACECGELAQTFSQRSPSTPTSFDTFDQAFSFNKLLLNSFNDVSYKTGYFSVKVINIS